MARDVPLPSQSAYHKRLKAAEPLLCETIRALAMDCPSWFDDLWITDATPVPCAASTETVKRSDLAGHAGYSCCASHSRFYWGFKLYLVCAGDGMPIMWCLADPKIGERKVLAATRPIATASLAGCVSGSNRSTRLSKGHLDLEDHGGRTPAGVFTRVAQRLLAMAAGIWHNWTTGMPDKRSLIAYDH